MNILKRSESCLDKESKEVLEKKLSGKANKLYNNIQHYKVYHPKAAELIADKLEEFEKRCEPYRFKLD